MSTQLIQVKFDGNKAIMRELSTMARKAIPTNVLKSIFTKAMRPMYLSAKLGAKQIQVQGNKFTNKGRPRARRNSKGAVSKHYRHRGGMDLYKAISLSGYSSRKTPGANITVRQKKLPVISKTTGKPYKAFGRKGVPIAQWTELGTKKRGKRGRIAGGHPIWRAFLRHKGTAMASAKQMILNEMSRNINSYQHIRFTNYSG